MTVLELLKRARALLAEKGWCKEWAAMTGDGSPTIARDPDACFFCAAGALAAAVSLSTDLSIIPAARRLLTAETNGVELSYFNDAQESVESVLEVFDRAIAKEEARLREAEEVSLEDLEAAGEVYDRIRKE